MSRYAYRLTPENAPVAPRWRDVALFYAVVVIVGSTAVLLL